ncbi:hypothetical protein B0H10DRAFT_986288 [Mycena sp. CBHHK59/15]|nr:hypothetical protein B0H10DRAFT_986288 [Mycena sp. CBHHK59/15]
MYAAPSYIDAGNLPPPIGTRNGKRKREEEPETTPDCQEAGKVDSSRQVIVNPVSNTPLTADSVTQIVNDLLTNFFGRDSNVSSNMSHSGVHWDAADSIGGSAKKGRGANRVDADLDNSVRATHVIKDGSADFSKRLRVKRVDDEMETLPNAGEFHKETTGSASSAASADQVGKGKGRELIPESDVQISRVLYGLSQMDKTAAMSKEESSSFVAKDYMAKPAFPIGGTKASSAVKPSSSVSLAELDTRRPN